MFAALALFAPSTGPEDWIAIKAWMPREDAATARDARDALQLILLDALASALAEHHVSIAPPDWRPFPGRFNLRYPVRIDGPGCDPCAFYSDAWLGAARNPGKVRAPEILGRYPAWRWGGTVTPGMIGGYPFFVDGLTAQDRLAFFQRFSLHLPDWAYIYVPASVGDFDLAGFPLMFNEGEPLYFIEPASEDEDAG